MDRQANNKVIYLVKGASGAGKSSRTLMVIKYLQTKYNSEPYMFTNEEGKEKEIGIYFPEINFLVFGKVFFTGNVEKFQGHDSVTGKFGSADNFSKFLAENNMNFLVEGAGTTLTYRLRPIYLKEELGFNNMFFQYYNFREKHLDEYNERIFGRSNKYTGDAMWRKSKSFNNEALKNENEIKEVTNVHGSKVMMHHFDDDFDESIDDLGLKLFVTFMQKEIDPQEFIHFCNDQDYINVNQYKNQ